VSPCFADEIEQRQTSQLIAAYHQRRRFERRIRSVLSLVNLWPIALGVLLGICAPFLRDLAANFAPWVSTVLFPFSAMVGDREFHLSRDTAQAIAHFLLYAQFPLEGMLARMVLKHRSSLFKVFGEVVSLHALAVLYVGLASGTLSS
jgi:hypothetical protein